MFRDPVRFWRLRGSLIGSSLVGGSLGGCLSGTAARHIETGQFKAGHFHLAVLHHIGAVHFSVASVPEIHVCPPVASKSASSKRHMARSQIHIGADRIIRASRRDEGSNRLARAAQKENKIP
ncbi:hypothetical protein [Novosphingobium sp. PhB165]|uniref:hypothetical protein n=1 Tax=Novosphingobium sp. PhB165 TaxID=2485105 RepID=UPI00140456DF|nr:hypothetical protein [Novosphingobium sp. PhB165]